MTEKVDLSLFKRFNMHVSIEIIALRKILYFTTI